MRSWLLVGTATLVGGGWLGGAAAGCASNADTTPVSTTTSSGPGGAAGSAGQGGHQGGQGGGGCTPSEELCDGIDNDCNGLTDEGCDCKSGTTRDCYSGDPALDGVGQCHHGTQSCVNGAWDTACAGEVLPDTEICNGLDDDCNGATDENLGMLTCGLGLCQQTVAACENGAPVACIPLPSQTEICDGQDNDCDGQIDEGCTCTEGHTQPCYTGSQQTRGVGECHDGLQTCSAQGEWGQCLGDQIPQNELCNDLDDDCDGATDDGNPGGGGSCTTGQLGVCAQGTQICDAGQLTCVQNLQPSAEICNGLDDDCDGQADEGDPGGGASCTTGQPGICAQGTYHCNSGAVQCVAPTPQPEQCNNLDDDCDGVVDDGNPGGGSPCTLPGLQGECAKGEMQCSGGQLSCAQVNFPQSEACGDGKDNDCDGSVDEGCSVNPPPEWNCSPSKYHSGGSNACDCGCGAFDPDCANLTVAACNTCNASGSCGSGACPADIAPNDNALCCARPLLDTGYELGSPNPYWDEYESQDLYAIIWNDNSMARSGNWFAWLGGWSGATVTDSVEQTITLPSGTATLSFWLDLHYCNGAGTDLFSATLDGNLLYSADNNDSDCWGGFIQRTVDISTYADGGSHTLRFQGDFEGANDDFSSFLVDDVDIVACP